MIDKRVPDFEAVVADLPELGADEAAPNVFNSVMTDFNTSLKLDNDGLLYWESTPPLAAMTDTIFNNQNGCTFRGNLFRAGVICHLSTSLDTYLLV